MKILILFLMAIKAADHLVRIDKHVCPIETPEMALKLQMLSATHKKFPFEMIPLNDDMHIAQNKQTNRITILHEQHLPQRVEELLHEVVKQCTLPLNEYTFAVDFAVAFGDERVHVVAQNKNTKKDNRKKIHPRRPNCRGLQTF